MAERLEYDDMDADIQATLEALGVLPSSDDGQVHCDESLPGQAAVPSLDIQELQRPVWHDVQRVLANRWRNDKQAHTLLEAMLGPYGSELFANVLDPLAEVSVLGRSAAQACCVVQFHKRRVEVVVCDNADPYPDSEAIEQFWTEDYLDIWQKNKDTLDVRQRPARSPYVVTASVILPQVCAVYGGTLSVMSRDQRVDFSCDSGIWNIQGMTVSWLAANAVLASLPYLDVPVRKRPGSQRNQTIPAQRTASASERRIIAKAV